MDLIEQLDHIFYPRAVAVIGASANPQKVGFICVANLIEAGFKGRIYPVNPNLAEVLGLRVYPAIGAIPDEVDLAMIVIPAQLSLSAVEECVAKGVKGVIIISGGFKEVDTEIGLELQAELRDMANSGGIRIIGPNTLGILNPRANLVASFQSSFTLSKVGGVAVATQSGGMCGYIVNALTNHNVGVSKAIGLGNRCNLDFDQVVTYFAEDKETEVITLYIEGLEQPKRLIKAARAVIKQKPIVAYKGGRGEDSNRATLSHTGALAGKHEFYEAAFAQAGIIPVDTITELVDIAKALNLQPPASGNRVAIFSAQAGAGIVIADKCRELGLRLAEFGPATRERLRQLVSPLNSIDNPVDIAWKSDEFNTSRDILKVVLDDDGVDAIIVAALFYASNMELMRAAIDITRHYRKPITVCLDSLGGKASTHLDALEKNHIPTYPLPERAVTGLAGLVRYAEILKTMD